MNRPPSPRSWYPPPQGSYGGPPPAEWYQWQDQQARGRSPSRDQQQRGRSPPPRGYSPPRPLSPRADHSIQRPLSPNQDSKRSLSPRNERPSSPRKEQQIGHRTISPIRVPSSPPRERLSSPRRERPSSPGRERQLSPRRELYSPRDRPPSPGRERPRSPYGWRARSPPRSYYDWNRRRSPPPHWIRRSPPRYGPSRSPPRSHWDYGMRPRSPPRWGPLPPPPPTHSYDRRWPGPPGPPPPSDRFYPPPPRKIELRSRTPPKAAVDSKPENKADDYFTSLAKTKEEEEVELIDLGPFDPDVAIGQKYIVAVSGYFCKVCSKFYNSESSAKLTHCKTRNHYDKWLSGKKAAALETKRDAAPEKEDNDEPPAKKVKQDTKDAEVAAEDAESKYDPSQPTDDPANADKDKPDKIDEEQSNEKQTCEQNGDHTKIADDTFGSDSETLIMSETNEEGEDHIEATLFNLRKLKVSQLKANLEKRGMKSTGLKPLLIKRLEKVLADEAAAVAAADSEQKADEESEQNADEKGGDDSTDDVGKECLFKLLESDVEVTNRKAQWINDREMERELLQLDGVKKVVSLGFERTRLFNGRRTNVEWTIKLMFAGKVPEDGLQFSIPSHQQLPFVALYMDDDENV